MWSAWMIWHQPRSSEQLHAQDVFLKKKLFGLNMEEGTGQDGQIDEYNKILTEVLALDIKIDVEKVLPLFVLLSALILWSYCD